VIRTLGLQSELLVMEGVSTCTDFGGYAVQETPSEPDYWGGNQLILRSPEILEDLACRQFRKHFPGARHMALVWDVPQLQAGDIDTAFVDRGWTVGTFDVLSLEGPMAEAPTPGGIVLRALDGTGDWEAAVALQMECGTEEGFHGDGHEAYLRRRNTNRRKQIAAGQGQWFGAFDGDLLVAQMGIFHNRAIARYQSVETRSSHRRRGLCTALLRHCRVWAQSRAPQATPVIVADADSAAGRLYRRMGFARAETMVEAFKPGYASGFVAAVT